MKKLITILIILFIAFPVHAEDSALIIPHEIKNGDVADASVIMEMFQAIQDNKNQNLVTMYDYGPPVNTTREFDHTNSPTTLTAIAYTEGMETWTFSDGHKVEYLTAEGPDGTLETGRREYNTSGVMAQDLTYHPAVQGVDLAGPKEVGKVWGYAYIAKKPDGSIYGAETKMFTIIGIETVAVPAGIFADCIKVFVITGNYKSVVWLAAGVGMVKMIGVNGLMELK